MGKRKEDKPPEIRVVRKTYFNHNAKQSAPWYEVQYFSDASDKWRSYTRYQSTIQFKYKSEAVEYAMRRKAGALSNTTFTEVIA